MTVQRDKSLDLILHIGLPKTGSSAIQKFCTDHQTWLADRGYYYPVHNVDVNGISGGHNKLYTFMRDNKKSDLLRFINRELHEAKKNGQTLILSSEGIHTFANAFSELLAGIKVKVIAFFRHPLDILFSAYNQQVKRHYLTESIDMYSDTALRYEKPILEGRSILNWHQHFDNQICVLPYSNSSDVKQSVLGRFLTSLDISPLTLPKIVFEQKINRGYCLAAIEFKRLLNQVITKNEQKLNKEIDHELQRLSDNDRFSRPLLQNVLLTSTYHALKTKFKPVVDKIEQQFLINIEDAREQDKNTYSALEIMREVLVLADEMKQNHPSVYKKIKGLIRQQDWDKANSDQIKLCEMFDEKLKPAQKAQQAFFNRNVIEKMPEYKDVDFLRELAKLFWQRGELDVAYKLIARAKELRKDGPVIKKLFDDIYHEYQTKISQ